MVKPGGTGSSSTDVISARLAPLPPRRSLSSIGGRGCVWSKSKTNGIGPPCPGRVHRVARRSLRGRSPQRGRAKPAYFPSGGDPERCSAPGAASRLVPRWPGVAHGGPRNLALEDLLGLAHEVTHDGELVGLEAQGH